MRTILSGRILCWGLLLALAVTGLAAQRLDFLATRLSPELGIPLGESAAIWGLGGGGEGALHFRLPGQIPVLSQFEPLIDGRFQVASNAAQKNLVMAGGGLGLQFNQAIIPRLGFSLWGGAGLYNGNYDGLDSAHWYWNAGLELRLRLSPAFSLSAGAAWQSYQSPTLPLWEGLNVRLGLRLDTAGLVESDNIALNQLETQNLFPVLYSQYDRNPLGRIRFTNREDGSIQNVRVSFFLKQFMDRPKDCLVLPELERGASAEAPLLALLNPSVMKLIESTRALAEVSISYDFLGAPRTQRIEVPLLINNRNAMNWDDDRKAAAFVSSKDPAVLRYAKYLAGLIRENSSPGMNQDLRFGIGLFEGLKLMGVNYVVDPTTPYSDFSENHAAVDFLQFPYQTLTYKGGDCDDLAILFNSIMASVGIRSAFITIPGHIYAAFSPTMSSREALDTFPDRNELIFQDGRVWIPVEVTMLKSGFAKAWSVGAQEWRDNLKDAQLIPMESSWQLYDPVSPPEQDTRITLPGDREATEAIKTGIERFVADVLPEKVSILNKELNTSPAKDRVYNRLGILYARFGKFREAKEAFAQAGKAGFVLADTNIGNIALLQKDFPGARASFEKSLRANPTDATTILGLAIALYESERYADAAVQYQKLAKLYPELAAQYDFLGKTEPAQKR